MIELHTTATANGFKASIMLEELGLSYEVHRYDLTRGDHQRPDYLALNPIGRLPLIVDREAGDGQPISVYGTAAILLYLAEKCGRLLPTEQPARARAFEWLGIVSSDIGPAYSGQFIFSVIAPEKLGWAIDYFERLCQRMLNAMNVALADRPYLAGDDYSIADVIAYPVAAVSALRFPGHLTDFPSIDAWAARVGARPAVQRGMRVGL